MPLPPHLPQGSARVIRCLTDQRNKLSTTCRAVLFDEEVRFSQNLDFQYPMRQVWGTVRKCDYKRGGPFLQNLGLSLGRSRENGSVREASRIPPPPHPTHCSPPSLSQACTIEVKLYCKDVPEGEARVIRCLQENKYQKDFGKECKEKVGMGGG